MRQFIRVQSIAFRELWHMHVVFTNGEERDIDLAPYIADGPIFAPVRADQNFFMLLT
jgi:hypothetical protein